MPWIIGGSALAGAATSAFGANKSNKDSIKAAERNYKHRYQWQMEDLRKAGLNPMLTINQGVGSVAQPNIENVGEDAGRVISQGGLQYKSAKADIALKEESASAAYNAGQNSAAQARLTHLQADLIDPQTRVNKDGTEGASSMYWKLKDVELNRALTDVAKAKQDIEQSHGAYMFDRSLDAIRRAHADYVARAAKLGLSEAQADSDFWEMSGLPGKIIMAVKQILK